MKSKYAVAAGLFVGVLAANMPASSGQTTQSAAGLPPQVVAQLQSLANEKRSRPPAQQKIDSQLLYASRMARGQAIAAGITFLETDVRPESDGRVIVNLRATVSPGLLAQLARFGADVIASHPAYDDIRIQVGFDQLEAVAALAEVRFVMPKQQAITQSRRGVSPVSPVQIADGHRVRHQQREAMLASLRATLGARAQQEALPAVGSRNSQGDRTHLAASARGKYGVTGAGVKIGVLSDSVHGLAAAQSSGDLPAVTVLPGKSGVGVPGTSGEGTAMLEIIHDLAPGAELFFATAFISESDFADNIRALRNTHGCDIIVDDVFYFNESPFQDGQLSPSPSNGAVITQAVKDVAAAGALYFSSAGNSGNLNDGTSGTWEGTFNDGGPAGAPLAGSGNIHLFAPGQGFNVLLQTGFLNTLKWADPLNFAAKNDYDLYRLTSDGTGIVGASTNNQESGAADPYEQVAAGLANQRLVILKWSGSAVFLHLSTVRGRLSIATDGEITGHPATTAANSFGVSATPAQSPGPFPNPHSATNTVENFTSDGPRRIFFTETGAAITPGDFTHTGGQVLNKPDITAADGVSVTGSGGFFPMTFFGTSAAAPHAAAIAALVKSRPGPALTSAQIRAAMTSTAIDIEAPGFDRDSGFGIVMAEAAIAAVEHNFSPPPGNIVTNGNFSSVITHGQVPNSHQPTGWLLFATPDLSHIVSNVTNGVFEYYRVDPGFANQAVIFQQTGFAFGPNFPLRAQFDLGNSDNVRKRISVLVLDSDFSDLAVCTFWLPPNSPLATYQMRSHTNKAWSNAAIYFYAATAGSNGGFYRLDNVSLQQNIGGPTTETECVDPLAPLPPGGAPSAELLVNRDFNTGSLAPWQTFGTITWQIASAHHSVGGTNTFEFVRPNTTPPSGVVFQSTGQTMAAGDLMTATFQLGNSSPALKRVTAILHDLDFTDLHACTFYLLPGQALSTYVMKTYTTEPWTNATLSVYPATAGPQQWIRLDNASLVRTPATATSGTDCEEPAVTAFSQPNAAVSTSARSRSGEPLSPRQWDAVGFSRSGSETIWSSIARASDTSILRLNQAIDLSTAASARLTFRSWLMGTNANADVQVSTDGVNWITIGSVSASEQFERIDVDLSDYAGQIISLRFVFRAAPAVDVRRPDIWRIDGVEVHRGGSPRREP